MARFRCLDHGVEMEVSGDGGRVRSIAMPPQVTPLNRGRIGTGIPSDCALPVAPSGDLKPGEIRRRDAFGRPMHGVCRVEQVS